MARLLVAFYSRTGNTQAMAEAVAEGAAEVDGVSVDLRPCSEFDVDELPAYDGIILGSPVYYGTLAAEMKKLIDDSVKFHGKLSGKVGGAFATAGVLGGGVETTVTDILHCLLVHGMVVQGEARGAHYGPTVIGKPDDKGLKTCRDYGKKTAQLALALHG